MLVRPKANLRDTVGGLPGPGGHATDVILIHRRIDAGAYFGTEVGAAIGARFGCDPGAVLERFLAGDVEPVGGIGMASDDAVGHLFGGEWGRWLSVVQSGGD